MKRRDFYGLAAGAAVALGARRAQAATTVSVWHIFGNATEPGLGNITKFNEMNKDVQIDGKFIPFGQLSQQLIKGVATGDVPDLITVDNPTVASFADQDVLTDLTARVKASSVVKQDRYFPAPYRGAGLRQARSSDRRDDETCCHSTPLGA